MKDLEEGEILSLADGSTAVIASLVVQEAEEGEEFTTYNFEVEDFHTYFVLPKGANEREADEAVWVHNMCGSGAAKNSAKNLRLGSVGGDVNFRTPTPEVLAQRDDVVKRLRQHGMRADGSTPHAPAPYNAKAGISLGENNPVSDEDLMALSQGFNREYALIQHETAGWYLKQGASSTSMTVPLGDGVTSFIHTHPQGILQPSLEDLIAFRVHQIDNINNNKSFGVMTIVARTKKGVVRKSYTAAKANREGARLMGSAAQFESEAQKYFP